MCLLLCCWTMVFWVLPLDHRCSLLVYSHLYFIRGNKNYAKFYTNHWFIYHNKLKSWAYKCTIGYDWLIDTKREIFIIISKTLFWDIYTKWCEKTHVNKSYLIALEMVVVGIGMNLETFIFLYFHQTCFFFFKSFILRTNEHNSIEHWTSELNVQWREMCWLNINSIFRSVNLSIIHANYQRHWRNIEFDRIFIWVFISMSMFAANHLQIELMSSSM